MRNTILILLACVPAFCAGYIASYMRKPPATSAVANTDSQVKGIGGIFFKCKDPGKVKTWYHDHLGFNANAYGVRFEWQQGCDTSRKDGLQWAPFKETTHYFDPSRSDFMINYVVTDLPALVEQLKRDGVTITDTMQTYDYGKFVHILDVEGNKVELYQPNYAHH